MPSIGGAENAACFSYSPPFVPKQRELAHRSFSMRLIRACRKFLGAQRMRRVSSASSVWAILTPRPAKISQPNASTSSNYLVFLVFVQTASRF
jgi:hypothetical protein